MKIIGIYLCVTLIYFEIQFPEVSSDRVKENRLLKTIFGNAEHTIQKRSLAPSTSSCSSSEEELPEVLSKVYTVSPSVPTSRPASGKFKRSPIELDSRMEPSTNSSSNVSNVTQVPGSPSNATISSNSTLSSNDSIRTTRQAPGGLPPPQTGVPQTGVPQTGIPQTGVPQTGVGVSVPGVQVGVSVPGQTTGALPQTLPGNAPQQGVPGQIPGQTLQAGVPQQAAAQIPGQVPQQAGVPGQGGTPAVNPVRFPT